MYCVCVWYRRRQQSIAPSLETAPSSSTSIPETISRAIHTAVTGPSQQHISPSHLHRKSLLLPSSPRPPANGSVSVSVKYQTGLYYKSDSNQSVSPICDMNLSCVRLEEWKRGRLTRIPHILLIPTSFAVPDRPIKSQSSVPLLVLKAHLSRVSSLSMLTGLIPDSLLSPTLSVLSHRGPSGEFELTLTFSQYY